jgi:hypothetical protein
VGSARAAWPGGVGSAGAAAAAGVAAAADVPIEDECSFGAASADDPGRPRPASAVEPKSARPGAAAAKINCRAWPQPRLTAELGRSRHLNVAAARL